VSIARLSAWLVACVVMFCATAGVSAQTTKPVAPSPPAAVGHFDKQTIERPAGTTIAKRDAAAVKPTTSSSGMDTFRVLAALAMVIVVIFLLRWIAQQFFGMPTAKKSSRAVQVLSRSMISPKQQVLLVQVGRRVIVVGDTGGQMSPLAQITDADEIAELVGQLREDKTTATAKSFGNIFGRAQTTFEENDVPEEKREEGPEDLDPALATTQAELSGLMERVRSVARGMKRDA
jgi:flagellar biogenesis protein FliO